MVWWVTLHDAMDATYVCVYTVWADDEPGAAAFAEQHNPGRVCVMVQLAG